MNGSATYSRNISVSGGYAHLRAAGPNNGALMMSNPSTVSPGFASGPGLAIEARILFPGSGSSIYNWPAFWTDGQNWPNDGEIDIAEGLGPMTANYHQGPGTDRPSNSGQIPGDWGGSFHIYSVYREANRIAWYFDGVQVRQISNPMSSGASIVNSQQYLIFNNCYGEQGPGVAGADMQVDYVRVWNPL